jgi:hypothetical protein
MPPDRRPDIAKIKTGEKEARNHYSNNPLGMVIPPEIILEQVSKYDDPGDERGHLYGVIVASLRGYQSVQFLEKYKEYFLA